jgi:hypothetical protein
MNTVSVSPGGFVLRAWGDGGGRARPFAGSVRDRDRDARPSPFSAFSISVSVCVTNCGPGSTSPAAFASRATLTRRLARAVPRGCMRDISTSPNAPISDESEAVDESRDSSAT